MASTPLLGLSLPADGTTNWGTLVNTSITSLIDSAVAGTTTISSASTPYTLTATTEAANESRQAVIFCTGARAGVQTIIAQAPRPYVIINATTGGFGVNIAGTGPTTGVTVPNGKAFMVAWNGSDFVTIGVTTVNLASDVTGILPVANGGTGQSTYTDGQLLIGNSTGNTLTKATLTAGSGVAITNGGGSISISATGSGGTVTGVTGTSPVVSSGGTAPAISLAAGYGDTLNPYASKTANSVLAAPSGSAGIPSFRALVANDIPTLNQNTSGTAGGLSSTLVVGSGGTGQTTYTDGQLLIGNSTGNTLTKATLSTSGTGLTVTNGSGSITLQNTAPDQTVALTGAGGTSISGTYPNFTITSTNTTYSTATDTTNGLIKLGSGTAQTTAANAVTSDASRTYALQLTSSGQAVVNVPWTGGSGGSVTGVTATSPVASSGGTAPVISLNAGYGDTLNPYASKTASHFLAAPNGSAGLPSFRAIAASDIPVLNQNTTGTALNLSGSQTANTVYAAPNGSAGTASFRSLVAADVPTLNQNTTGNAGGISNAGTAYITATTAIFYTSSSGGHEFTGNVIFENNVDIQGAATVSSVPIVTTTGSQTLTNKTISGSNNTLQNIANASLTNSAITVNSTAISLGGSATVTAVNPNALTIGTGLSGTSYNGSAAVTVAIDSTVATLTGSQILTNKSISGSSNTITNVSLTASVTGILPVANGGTGVTTSSGTGANVLSASPSISSPNLTGTPIAPTASSGTNSTQVATTAFVQTAIGSTGATGTRGQAFTSNGTFTIPTGVTALKITVVGGGGGSGGGGTGGCCASYIGGSGAGGGAAIKYLTGLTPGNTLAVTVGGAGSAGALSSNGGTGGTSQVASGTQSITTVSATGGGGAPVSATGAVGGIGSNGDLNIGGQGGSGIAFTGSIGGNQGGSSIFGGGGGSPASGSVGVAGRAYGGGASGGAVGAAGGDGAAGAVIFEW